ncbi:hypothetical protein VQ02_27795 [Methylobacterium variabile]|jgi:hypothetical protein|uniref:Transmembrane protein n=1 Tax=Methylobacterium variabile TaxID=298794 RepID=A0A0J6S5T7_9HYPH|nr:hypothetical protein [Methylobacterium variabile]KMO30550.1 hypothetical protein VQ02_27795 [Methylobacterium variabile]
MRKLAIIPALAVALGAFTTIAPSPAEAQGWRGGHYGHGHGYGRGYAGRPYAYGGRRRGISPGAAVGLGIAGAAVGAIGAAAAADAARRNGYGYYGAPAPAYGPYGYGY